MYKEAQKQMLNDVTNKSMFRYLFINHHMIAQDVFSLAKILDLSLNNLDPPTIPSALPNLITVRLMSNNLQDLSVLGVLVSIDSD